MEIKKVTEQEMSKSQDWLSVVGELHELKGIQTDTEVDILSADLSVTLDGLLSSVFCTYMFGCFSKL